MYCAIENYNEFNYSGNVSHIGEFIYDYNKSTLLDKIDIVKKHEDNIVTFSILAISDDILMEMKDISKLGNVKFRLESFLKKEELAYVLENKIQYYYDYMTARADTLDSLCGLCNMGVSDVFITGELAFKMNVVKNVTKEQFNVQTRIIPNIAQELVINPHIQDGDKLTSFWVRPEDLDLYEEYIDVIDLFGLNEKQVSVIYNIYFLEKTWSGDLGKLIIGVQDFNNLGVPKHFTDARLNCGKICNINRCHKCHKYKNIAKLLKQEECIIES